MSDQDDEEKSLVFQWTSTDDVLYVEIAAMKSLKNRMWIQNEDFKNYRTRL
jgi:hypothetical protein